MSNEADLRESVALYQSGKLGRVATPTYDRIRLRYRGRCAAFAIGHARSARVATL